MELKKYKLSDVAKVEISSVDKKTKAGETPVRLCNFTDVYHNWAITSDMADTFMEASANTNEIEKFTIKKGQVAFTKDSETRDDIGIPTYIADNFENVLLGYHCALITPDETKLCGKYLNAFMHSAYIQKYFENSASGSGQRYTLSLETLESMPLLLPSLAEQKRIGKIFTSLDKKIELNHKINQNLEAMAKLLYDYWFVQFDFPNEEGKPYKSSGGKMVWNEKIKREIPIDWEILPLFDAVSVQYGFPFATEQFTEEETEEILQKFLPELKQDIKKRKSIYQMTDGNAFFLMECINVIKEKGYTLEISQKTNNVIKARLAGIPEQEMEVLECMSLFPEKISIEEIELLLPKMDRLTLVRILEKLQERHLVREVLVGWNVYYQFEHQVFREYIYEKQSIGKKRTYHQILAEYYESRWSGKKNFGDLPMIIHHYEKSHNMVKTYQYKILYLREYYTIINENFPVLHWEIEYGSQNPGFTFKADEMLKLAEEVIRFDGDSRQLQEMKMEMYYIKGRFDIAVGDYESGIENIRQSMILAEMLGNTKALLNNFKQMIFFGIQTENLPLVKKYVEEGMTLINVQEPDERGVFLRLRGWYLLHEEKYEEARQTLTEARELFEFYNGEKNQYSMSIAACYNYIGDVCRATGDYQSALSYYKIAIDKGTGKVVTNGMGQFYSNAGQIYYLLGKYR